jgi:IclR family transcriptional regulator, KDG regulon repressor
MGWQAANRFLEGLVRESVVVKDETSKRYQLSFRVCDWASSTIQSRTPISLARKECIRLALETGRQINFLVLEEMYVVTIERCDPSDGIPLSRFVPARRVWFESAAGLAIAAFSSPQVRGSLLDRTFARTEWSPPGREKIEDALDEIRKQGFAVTPEVLPGGSVGIVVPVRDRSGDAVAVVNTPFPAAELESASGSEIIGKLKECASTISHYLGFEESVSH